MLARQSKLTLAVVLSGIVTAGLCAWVVNMLLPEHYANRAVSDIAAPIDYENLPPGASLANLERGRSYYAQLCMACHGGRADGKGEWAYRVTPQPIDLRSERTYARSDEQLFNIISEGLIGTPMAALKDRLSPIQRWQIVAYIRHITPRQAANHL